MDKNHSHKISDEKLDRFARELLRGVILTDEEIDETADAPRLWWQVRSRIADEKARREKRRFFGWRWQPATLGALAILVAAGAAFWLSDSAKTEIAVLPGEKIIVPAEETKTFETKSDAPQSIVSQNSIVSPIVEQKKTPFKPEKFSTKAARQIKSARVRAVPQPAKIKSANRQETEIATNFIALSYLPATESGQIVRVKVPRSMMVSLGVTTKVERASELVNAEVVVGDDGAARAIRFLAN